MITEVELALLLRQGQSNSNVLRSNTSTNIHTFSLSPSVYIIIIIFVYESLCVCVCVGMCSTVVKQLNESKLGGTHIRWQHFFFDTVAKYEDDSDDMVILSLSPFLSIYIAIYLYGYVPSTHPHCMHIYLYISQLTSPNNKGS